MFPGHCHEYRELSENGLFSLIDIFKDCNIQAGILKEVSFKADLDAV